MNKLNKIQHLLGLSVLLAFSSSAFFPAEASDKQPRKIRQGFEPYQVKKTPGTQTNHTLNSPATVMINNVSYHRGNPTQNGTVSYWANGNVGDYSNFHFTLGERLGDSFHFHITDTQNIQHDYTYTISSSTLAPNDNTALGQAAREFCQQFTQRQAF